MIHDIKWCFPSFFAGIVVVGGTARNVKETRKEFPRPPPLHLMLRCHEIIKISVLCGDSPIRAPNNIMEVALSLFLVS